MFSWSKAKPGSMAVSPDEHAPVADRYSTAVSGAITALRENPRKPGRYAVHVDGKSVAIVNAAYLHDAGIKVGTQLDEPAGDRLLVAARELERWLLQRGFDRADVTDAVQRLTEIGAIDDSQFARAFARSRALGKGMSRRRLTQELSRRGVARPMADAAIADVLEEESVDERALLESAAHKKLELLHGHDAETVRRRLYGYLVRRGYDVNDIQAVLRKLLAKLEAGR